MWIARLRCISLPRWGVSLVLSAPVLAALLGCAPVIETTVRDRDLPPVEGAAVERVSIMLDTSRLERTPDTLDPARLKDRLEEELRLSGMFPQHRVMIGGAPADEEPFSVTIALTRLEYTKRGLRFPPAPPFGIACLVPVIAPFLLTRDYLKLEAAAEAELLVHDRQGALTGMTYVNESATGRADFFASGEEKAATVLQDIAFRNFSGQVVREFLFLTR